MRFQRAFLMITGLLAAHGAIAQEHSTADLAKQLANPIASLISVPFQFNWDNDVGPVDDGDRFTLNIQPVIPIDLNADWNIISRTIVPVINQRSIFPNAGNQAGIGDTVQSFFFSPKAPTDSGWIWGVGPVFLLPTATDDLLGADQLGLGPTGVALKQSGPLTYGALANHIWGVENKDTDIDSTFIQPFMSYTTPTAWSYTLQAEATYDWNSEQWSIPASFLVSKVTKVGNQLVQFGGGPRYYLSDTDNGPKGLGFRFVAVLLFPR